MPKRLVLFVEGEGDAAAVPVLVKHLLTAMNAWEHVYLDRDPFRTGGVGKVVRDGCKDWARWLRATVKRGNLGGVLLVLDGDAKSVLNQPFCPARVGRLLSRHARSAGGGSLFSVATVFALREYETWLVAGVESLAGRTLPGGEPGIRPGTFPPDGDLEATLRDAKEWLGEHMPTAYKPTVHQKPLTELIDLEVIRRRGLPSFRRLERALQQLVQAIDSGSHVVTPADSTS